MTTLTQASERNLRVQCRRCGGLMVPDQHPGNVIDAETSEEAEWHCLTCRVSDRQQQEEGNIRDQARYTSRKSSITYHVVTPTYYRRRVAR